MQKFFEFKTAFPIARDCPRRRWGGLGQGGGGDGLEVVGVRTHRGAKGLRRVIAPRWMSVLEPPHPTPSYPRNLCWSMMVNKTGMGCVCSKFCCVRKFCFLRNFGAQKMTTMTMTITTKTTKMKTTATLSLSHFQFIFERRFLFWWMEVRTSAAILEEFRLLHFAARESICFWSENCI